MPFLCIEMNKSGPMFKSIMNLTFNTKLLPYTIFNAIIVAILVSSI
jgi:hypothetical protein